MDNRFIWLSEVAAEHFNVELADYFGEPDQFLPGVFIEGGSLIFLETPDSIHLAHEIGHAMAYYYGLDFEDEKFAWLLAEKLWLCAFPLPDEWEKIKISSLDTYNL